MADPQPLLPATPWYESEVQLRAVLAMGAQLLSVLTRIADHLGLHLQVSVVDVDAVFADLTQGAAIWLGVLAIIKRQKSQVSPLTLTAGGAKAQTTINPPVLDSDPTKLPKEPK